MLKPAWIAILLFCVFSFRSEDPSCAGEKLTGIAPFPIGTAINTDKLKNEERYWTAAVAHYNSFTPEKVMKPSLLHPQKGVFSFSEPDHLVDFCQQNNIRLHGHTLIWHKSLPAWMERFKGSNAEWNEMLKEHIQKIVTHYKGKVKSWDVVNEAFNDDGTLRPNIWLTNIGESYIEKAFLYAAESDPDAKLFYNDYSLEKNDRKLQAVIELLAGIRQKGVKVDGIGMQMHVSLEYPLISEINGAALRIQAADFLVHYSELDVDLAPGHSIFSSRKKLFLFQKQRIKEIVEGYMKLDPAHRFGITLWGVSDNDSWLTESRVRSRPLLLNHNYKLKPAYCGFLEGLAAMSR